MKTVTMMMLCVMLVATSFVVACGGDGTGEDEYIPAPFQVPGNHSRLSCRGVDIRDDKLAAYIGSKMLSRGVTSVPPVKDVIIMFNSCYGGGFGGDFQRNFGTSIDSNRVTWIFGSASQPNAKAHGADNDNYWVKNWGFGSWWTTALAGDLSHPWWQDDDGYWHEPPKGSIKDRTSDNVLEDFEMARDNDWKGPIYGRNVSKNENPLIACGIGGESIEWNAGMRYEAVIFSGSPDADRHHHNVDLVEEALEIVWDGSSYNIQKIDGGTKAQLLSAIDTACSRLDFTTTLVLYFDDHGSKSFDIDEYKEWTTPVYYTGGIIDFPLEADWLEDFSDMHTYNQTDQGDEPAPFIILGLIEPIFSEEWAISLNDVPIALPAGNLTGEVQLAVNWTSIQTGTNTLEISPLGEPSGPMVLDNLELYSGPISDGGEAMLYNLTTSSTAGGVVTTPGEGTFFFEEGDVVGLVATPDAGYDFVEWTGDVDTIGDVNKATTTITIYSDYSITANFGWCNIKQVSAGRDHTVGLKSNGTVVAVGSNSDGQCNVGSWTDITQVAAGGYHTVGLESDGTVVATGNNAEGECNVGGWTDITQVAAGYYHTVGLKSNGTVVAVGDNYYGQCNVETWTGITQVTASYGHTVGLCSDGTVVAVGHNDSGQCNVGGWSNIAQVAAGFIHTVGLEPGGTVVAVGYNYFGQCNVSGWADIIQVAAGMYHTVGVKSDGTVVAVGRNDDGQCNVGG